jgi:hypothetical protein
VYVVLVGDGDGGAGEFIAVERLELCIDVR